MRLFDTEQAETRTALEEASVSPRPLRPDLPTDVGELHLLVEELRDERSSARMREAMWISIIVHLVVFLLFMLSPRIFPKSWFTPVTISSQIDTRQPTFLTLPPDAQKYVTKPKTNILSDKNRIAQSPNPTQYRPTPEEIERMRRQGRPGQQAQAKAQTAQPPAAAPAATQPPVQQAQATPPKQEPPQEAKLREPEQERAAQSRPNPFAVPQSAGSAIQDAVRATATGRGAGNGGDYGEGIRPHAGVQSSAQVLSDTQGWDYGPYLARVVNSVRLHWYQIIPEEAGPPFYKTGVVVIDFTILRNGSVGPVIIRAGSGTNSLDHAARGGVTASNPFNPLPAEYKGDELKLRFFFHYLGPKDTLQ